MNDEFVNRLFEITERYECLLRAVKEQPKAAAILERAKAIEQERGHLREGGE
jgi:hypothetical protein